jgi:hypothetical protein
MKTSSRDDSLLISGIDSSTIHQRLELYSKENLVSSRLDLSESQYSDCAIRVQESFSISEIYREVLKDGLDPGSKDNETNEFFKLLEDNTGMVSKQKIYSKLDESSIVGENCKVLVDDIDPITVELLKKQQRKYSKAFLVLQAHFISAKEGSERKIGMLNNQIRETYALIKENKDFANRLEASVEQRIESIKEEVMQKFRIEAENVIQKYQNRESDLRKQTKNKIVNIRKEVDSNCDVFKSFDGSRAKNSEDLLRKNCEMRLKIALMQGESQYMKDL